MPRQLEATLPANRGFAFIPLITAVALFLLVIVFLKPFSDHSSPPSGDTLQTQEETSTPKSIGYVGCSITYQIVEGYFLMGGRSVWPVEQRYDDGGVMNWGNPRMPFQRVFDENIQRYPDTEVIWLQLCIPVHDPVTYTHANSVVDMIRTRLPDAEIYVSSLAPYAHLCEGSGTTGVALGQRLAEELAERRADVKLGPTFSTLTESETENDKCHLEAPGKRKLGKELKEFFDEQVP